MSMNLHIPIHLYKRTKDNNACSQLSKVVSFGRAKWSIHCPSKAKTPIFNKLSNKTVETEKKRKTLMKYWGTAAVTSVKNSSLRLYVNSLCKSSHYFSQENRLVHLSRVAWSSCSFGASLLLSSFALSIFVALKGVKNVLKISH